MIFRDLLFSTSGNVPYILELTTCGFWYSLIGALLCLLKCSIMLFCSILSFFHVESLVVPVLVLITIDDL